MRMPHVDAGSSAREAERNRETSIGRSVHGFTISARVGKPFRFDDEAPRGAGEAKPAADPPAVPAEIEFKKTNEFHDKKFAHEASTQDRQASEESANRGFRALPGSLLRALFRRRVHPESQDNNKV